MKNCMVAQSGGPTSVINASVVGVIEANDKTNFYDKVYAGINGLEGILEENIIDLSNLSQEEKNLLKQTPSSGLGSCRYKIKDFKEDESEYIRLFEILDSLDIHTFFYIGGNDSMDTVSKLSEYAELHNIDKQIIGIPKTIDNDLLYTDHTPGYGSAAKHIATSVLETYLDSSVYINNGIFILESMGRDTGWLAASAALAKLDGEPVADFIYLPEATFYKERFLKDVKQRFRKKKKVYIVVSEGLKNEDGSYLYDTKKTNDHDSFSHPQLGGLGSYLENLIKDSRITQRVKVLELGVGQRSAMHNVSKVDMEEAYLAGKSALEYSMDGDTGFMVAFDRSSNDPYKMETFKIEASKIANGIKYFPEEWITDRGNGVTQEAVEYIKPLIQGSPSLEFEDGVPKYFNILDKI